MREAMFYLHRSDVVICNLCPHNCVINDGRVGKCGVRKNVNGRLVSLSYGQICAANVDPIEKKPLYHFLPGSLSFSIAGYGCNFHCLFCQNWQISQVREELLQGGKSICPEDLIRYAKKYACLSISYTYTEPTVFYEFALDCCVLAKDNGLFNIWVSNGFINKDPLDKILPYLDAANIDLKTFDDSVYQKVCGGKLKPVLDTIKRLYDAGVWIEITTLVIPDLNDSPGELESIAGFIASLSVDIPWHISAFYPQYKMLNKRPTSLQILLEAQVIGKKAGLRYIYLGNVGKSEETYCPNCGMLLVRRCGFNVLENYLAINDGCCPSCNFKVAGLWKNSIVNHG